MLPKALRSLPIRVDVLRPLPGSTVLAAAVPVAARQRRLPPATVWHAFRRALHASVQTSKRPRQKVTRQEKRELGNRPEREGMTCLTALIKAA